MAIRLEYSVTAKCKPEHVWRKFEKLEEWPWWNRVIGQVHWLAGQPWQKGSQFLMEMVYPRKMSFKPVILESAPPNKLAWVGKVNGVTGEHWFSFEALADGTTVIKTWEEFSGLMTVFITANVKKSIIATWAAWLDALKSEAEKIAREEHARS